MRDKEEERFGPWAKKHWKGSARWKKKEKKPTQLLGEMG